MELKLEFGKGLTVKATVTEVKRFKAAKLAVETLVMPVAEVHKKLGEAGKTALAGLSAIIALLDSTDNEEVSEKEPGSNAADEGTDLVGEEETAVGDDDSIEGSMDLQDDEPESESEGGVEEFAEFDDNEETGEDAGEEFASEEVEEPEEEPAKQEPKKEPANPANALLAKKQALLNKAAGKK